MKITKDMHDEGLRPLYNKLRFMDILFKYPSLLKLVDGLSRYISKGKSIKELSCAELYIPRSGGGKLRVRIYKPKDAEETLPVMLYCHGGGYIAGNPEQSGDVIKSFIKTRPCVVVAPDYRKAFEEPYPAGFDDCYDTLLWIKTQADELGIDPTKVIVAGHSAGGGLTAAITLKARNTGDINIAFQMPFYPMIDDLQPSDPERDIDSLMWNTEANRLGWNTYLAGLVEKGLPIPSYAAPARNQDYSHLPPTITMVGTLDPFHKETLGFVESLKDAGTDVLFKEYQGCFHAFEHVSNCDISKDALVYTFDSYADFYDRYLR